MAAMNDDLMRAIDLTIDAVMRRTRSLLPRERDAAMREAMRELATPRSEPRQWDSADISYDKPQESR